MSKKSKRYTDEFKIEAIKLSEASDKPLLLIAKELGIAISTHWLYLCVVLDLYSRAVVGWSMAERMQATLVENAILCAVRLRSGATNVIFHSDKGSQYCSDRVRKLLNGLKFRQSMSGRGNCYDNAVTETFFSTLKKELVYQCKYSTRSEAKSSIFEYIEVFYNRVRIHSSIDYVSPFEYERRVA